MPTLGVGRIPKLMRYRFGSFAYVVLVLSATAHQGCDEEQTTDARAPDAHTPSEDAGRAPIATFREFCDAVREESCGRLEPCCAAGQVAFEREVCERDLFKFASAPLAWCGTSQPPAMFDADAAAQCLSLRAQSFDSCDFRRADDPIVVEAARVCEHVAVFTRDPNASCEDAPCFAPPEMVSDCDVLFDAPGPYLCSTPQARPGLGEACGGYCDFGLFCDEGQCRAPRPDGAACYQDYHCSSNECTDASGTSGRICEPVRTIGWMECELFNDPRIPHGGDDGGINGGAANDAGL